MVGCCPGTLVTREGGVCQSLCWCSLCVWVGCCAPICHGTQCCCYRFFLSAAPQTNMRPYLSLLCALCAHIDNTAEGGLTVGRREDMCATCILEHQSVGAPMQTERISSWRGAVVEEQTILSTFNVAEELLFCRCSMRRSSACGNAQHVLCIFSDRWICDRATETRH